MGKKGYVDIHSHILPGVDDGSRNMDMTRELLKAEIAEGVTEIIATPHFDTEENLQDPEHIREVAAQVQKVASELSDNLTIHTGCEILFSRGILDLIQQDKVLTLGDTNYVLVEFYPSESHRDIYRAMRDIIQLGKSPVLAHVERYECFIGHLEYVHELIELGAYIQMNARSLTGKRFDKRTRFCKAAVQKGLVHFFGTDCHNMEHRPPQMEKTAKMVEKLAGEYTARRLTGENARVLLEGKYI